MPVYQAEQRLLRLRQLRNEIDLEIRQIERGLKAREKRARQITPRKPIDRPEPHPNAGVEPRVVRVWARAQGMNDVGIRGTLPHRITELYLEAHQGATP